MTTILAVCVQHTVIRTTIDVQTYLFDRVDIKHMGIDERDQGKNMTKVQTQISVWDGRAYMCVVRLLNILTWWTWFIKFPTQV